MIILRGSPPVCASIVLISSQLSGGSHDNTLETFIMIKLKFYDDATVKRM